MEMNSVADRIILLNDNLYSRMLAAVK